MTSELPKSFTDKIAEPDGSGCRIWLGYIGKQGYGHFRYRMKLYTAPRFMMGSPTGRLVLHHCDNRACVTRSHLYVGSKQDNYNDMRRRGRVRARSGETHPHAKLTARQVVELRATYAKGGYTYRSLALDYGVAESTIGGIVIGREWKHV